MQQFQYETRRSKLLQQLQAEDETLGNKKSAYTVDEVAKADKGQDANAWTTIKGMAHQALGQFTGSAASLADSTIGGFLQEVQTLLGVSMQTFGANEEDRAIGDKLIEKDNPITYLNKDIHYWNEKNAEYYGKNAENSRVASFANKYGTEVLRQVPNAILAVMSGGGSLAAEATTEGLQAYAALQNAPTVVKLMSSAMRGIANMYKDPTVINTFVQEAGGSIDEAMEDGATEEQALLYATVVGMVNAGIEVGGLIEGGGGSEHFVSELFNKAQGGAKVFLEYLKSIPSEVLEELEQNMVSNASKALYGQDVKLASMDRDENAIFNVPEMLETAKDTAITTAISGGAQMGINAAIDGVANRGMPGQPVNAQQTPDDFYASMAAGRDAETFTDRLQEAVKMRDGKKKWSDYEMARVTGFYTDGNGNILQVNDPTKTVILAKGDTDVEAAARRQEFNSPTETISTEMPTDVEAQLNAEDIAAANQELDDNIAKREERHQNFLETQEAHRQAFLAKPESERLQEAYRLQSMAAGEFFIEQETGIRFNEDGSYTDVANELIAQNAVESPESVSDTQVTNDAAPSTEAQMQPIAEVKQSQQEQIQESLSRIEAQLEEIKNFGKEDVIDADYTPVGEQRQTNEPYYGTVDGVDVTESVLIRAKVYQEESLRDDIEGIVFGQAFAQSDDADLYSEISNKFRDTLESIEVNSLVREAILNDFYARNPDLAEWAGEYRHELETESMYDGWDGFGNGFYEQQFKRDYENVRNGDNPWETERHVDDSAWKIEEDTPDYIIEEDYNEQRAREAELYGTAGEVWNGDRPERGLGGSQTGILQDETQVAGRTSGGPAGIDSTDVESFWPRSSKSNAHELTLVQLATAWRAGRITPDEIVAYRVRNDIRMAGSTIYASEQYSPSMQGIADVAESFGVPLTLYSPGYDPQSSGFVLSNAPGAGVFLCVMPGENAGADFGHEMLHFKLASLSDEQHSNVLAGIKDSVEDAYYSARITFGLRYQTFADFLLSTKRGIQYAFIYGQEHYGAENGYSTDEIRSKLVDEIYEEFAGDMCSGYTRFFENGSDIRQLPEVMTALRDAVLNSDFVRQEFGNDWLTTRSQLINYGKQLQNEISQGENHSAADSGISGAKRHLTSDEDTEIYSPDFGDSATDDPDRFQDEALNRYEDKYYDEDGNEISKEDLKNWPKGKYLEMRRVFGDEKRRFLEHPEDKEKVMDRRLAHAADVETDVAERQAYQPKRNTALESEKGRVAAMDGKTVPTQSHAESDTYTKGQNNAADLVRTRSKEHRVESDENVADIVRARLGENNENLDSEFSRLINQDSTTFKQEDLAELEEIRRQLVDGDIREMLSGSKKLTDEQYLKLVQRNAELDDKISDVRGNSARILRQTGRALITSAQHVISRATKALLPGITTGGNFSPNSENAAKVRKIIKYTDRIDKASDAQSLINIINEISYYRGTDRVFGGQMMDSLDKGLDFLSKTENGMETLRNIAYASADNITTDALSKGFTDDPGEALKTIRANNLLSNMSTFLNNIGNNDLSIFMGAADQNIGRVFDRWLAKSSGTETLGHDSSVNIFNAENLKAQKEAFVKSMINVMYDVDVEGDAKYEGTGGGTHFKMTSDKLFDRIMAQYEMYIRATLVVPDDVAKARVESGVQSGLDKAHAEGRITDKAYAELTADAQGQAKHRTFQDDGDLAQAVEKAKQWLNKAHIRNVGLGDLIMVFSKVPANVAQQKIEHSPIGAMLGLIELVNAKAEAKKGKLTAVEQAKAARAAGRSIGTVGLMALGTGLAAMGGIGNTDSEDDDDKKALMKDDGISGLYINLSAFGRFLTGGDKNYQRGDTVIDGDWMEIFSLPISMGALLYHDIQDGAKWYELPALSIQYSKDNILDTLSHLPGLQQIESLINGYNYSKAETSTGKAVDALVPTTANIAATYVVPNAYYQTVAGLDNTVRDVYNTDSAWEQAANMMKDRSLILRQTMAPALDSFGNERKYGSNRLMGVLNKSILPGDIRGGKEHTELGSALEKLSAQGMKNIYPEKNPPSKVKDIALTADQKREYSKFYGQMYNEVVNDLISAKGFNDLDAAQQAELINEMKNYAGKLADANFLKSIDSEQEVRLDKWMTDLKDSEMPKFLMARQQIKTVMGSETRTNLEVDELFGGGKNSVYGSLSEQAKDILNGSYADLDDLYEARQKGIKAKELFKAKELWKTFKGEGANKANAEALVKRIEQIPGLTDEQKRYLEDKYTLSYMQKVEATQLNKYRDAAGISAEVASNVRDMIESVEGGTGKSSRKFHVLANYSELTEEQKWSLFYETVSSTDKQRANGDKARQMGLTFAEFVNKYYR